MRTIIMNLWSLIIVFGTVLGQAAGQQSPIIRPDPLSRELYTVEGNSSFIACYILAGGPGTTVGWYKESVQVATGEVLRFPNPTPQDSGTYNCIMSNSHGQNERIFTVKVYGLHVSYGLVGYPSRIISTQEEKRLMKWYDTFYMKGTLENTSSIILTYFTSLNLRKAGYGYDEGKGDLLIPNTALHHEGNYTLTANDFITTTWSFNTFHVYVRPTQVIMEGFPDHVVEAESVSASCVVHRVKPANMTFSWYLGSNAIAASSHTETSSSNVDGTFKVISTLTDTFLRRDNMEQLQCIAVHGVDTTLQSQDQKLVLVYYKYQTRSEVKDLQSAPVEGGYTTLVCQSVDEGKPTSTSYKWYKSNVELSDNDKFQGVKTHELVIRDLASSDDGHYGCRIDNDAGPGIQKGTFQLEVLYKPRITLHGLTAVAEGEDVSITCSVDAKPDFGSLVWYLDGRLLPTPNGDVAIYKLLPSHRRDKGRYICEVTNEIGTSRQYHVLNVKYKPSGRPTVSPVQRVMLVSTAQKLTCTTDALTDPGNPPHDTFAWTRNDIQLSHQAATMDITPTRVSDSVRYTCAVGNEIGLSNFSQPVPIVVEALLNIDGNRTHLQHEPRFNDATFTISYTVTGGRDLHMTLRNSSTPVSQDDFTITKQNISGDFPFGQTSATKVTYVWKLVDRDLSTCETVTYFNGDYSFQTSGTVAGVPATKTAVFRIAVQYPAMWRGRPRSNFSPTKVPKTLVCDICANPAPTFYEWRFNKGMLPDRTTKKDNRLQISNVNQEHFGTYECKIATVIKGQASVKTFDIKLEETGSPLMPEALKTASRTSETLLITWSPGLDGGYPLTGYELEYLKDGDSTWQTYTDLIPPCMQVCEIRLFNLQPATKYSIRVRAMNERPVVLATDPYSAYAIINTQTKGRQLVHASMAWLWYGIPAICVALAGSIITIGYYYKKYKEHEVIEEHQMDQRGSQDETGADRVYEEIEEYWLDRRLSNAIRDQEVNSGDERVYINVPTPDADKESPQRTAHNTAGGGSNYDYDDVDLPAMTEEGVVQSAADSTEGEVKSDYEYDDVEFPTMSSEEGLVEPVGDSSTETHQYQKLIFPKTD